MDKFEQVYNKLISESNKSKTTKKKVIKEEIYEGGIIDTPIDIIKDELKTDYPALNIDLNENFKSSLFAKLQELNLSDDDIQNLADKCLEIAIEKKYNFAHNSAKENMSNIKENIADLTDILMWYEIYKYIFKFQN